MARRPRIRLAGVPQHVLQRGNNRCATFFQDTDYAFYLECLRRASRKRRCAVHAYVLMSNHAHILMTPDEDESISLMMQDIGRDYVQYVNARYGRTGTLWEGRFKASLVDTSTYFLTCMAYIELNPVRAGMVTSPEAYRWSSYGANALGSQDSLLSPHAEYLALDPDDGERQRAYAEIVRSRIGENRLREIRDATNKGWPMGSVRFKDEIAAALGCATRPPKRGRPYAAGRRTGEGG